VVFVTSPGEIVAGIFFEMHPKTEDNWRFAFLDCWNNGAVMTESFAAARRGLRRSSSKKRIDD
jgi:hypothetical protein